MFVHKHILEAFCTPMYTLRSCIISRDIVTLLVETLVLCRYLHVETSYFSPESLEATDHLQRTALINATTLRLPEAVFHFSFIRQAQTYLDNLFCFVCVLCR